MASKENKTRTNPNPEIITGTGTILLIDDEEIVLTVTRAMLQKLGYDVLTAANGPDGLAILEEKNNEIDMVILDVVMPEMSGSQVCERIRERWPDLKVLVSSGYIRNGATEKAMAECCSEFMQKPFSLRELSERVARLLEN